MAQQFFGPLHPLIQKILLGSQRSFSFKQTDEMPRRKPHSVGQLSNRQMVILLYLHDPNRGFDSSVQLCTYVSLGVA